MDLEEYCVEEIDEGWSVSLLAFVRAVMIGTLSLLWKNCDLPYFPPDY